MSSPIYDRKASAKRLDYLLSCLILDTEPEELYDAIVEEASSVMKCPTALISLVDTDRQWFKSAKGLEAKETPIDQSFCAHALLSEAPLVVQDATKDDRFKENPLVTGDPKVRFYVGAQLVNPEGIGYGTLCVIDYKPRRLAPADLERLQMLAQKVSKLIEIRRLKLHLQSLQEDVAATRSQLDDQYESLIQAA